ncbi:MAG: ECF-type sigma factor [Planctomycetota bacterium]
MPSSDSSKDSVTQWIGQLKAGEQRAAGKLWERYFDRLVRMAGKRLRIARRRVSDEEDAALSAFHLFCRGAAEDRFPKLEDRDDLWQLLVMLTDRKAIDQVRRHELRLKRGGGRVVGESAFGTPSARGGGIHELAGFEPTPEFAALVAEEQERLLAKLNDDLLRAIALWKLAGYSNEEIAEKIGKTPRTVTRKLDLIRVIWSQEEKA